MLRPPSEWVGLTDDEIVRQVRFDLQATQREQWLAHMLSESDVVYLLEHAEEQVVELEYQITKLESERDDTNELFIGLIT